MPLADEEPPAEGGPLIRVGGSVAAELDWVMHAAWHPQPDDEHPTLARICSDGSELGDRVRSLWGGDEAMECGLGMELSILAHHGGLLFSLDAEELLGRLEGLCADGPVELALASETETDRVAIRRRLELLRTSPELRSRFVQLCGELWAAVGGDWRRHGRSAVEQAVVARRELQRRNAPWQEVARTPNKPLKPGVISLVASLGPGGLLAVVPAYFARRYGYMDLPGAVLVSVAAETGVAQARARTQLLARRLRTISDPTRLAILEVLRHEPSTVTELAEAFSLAQPTVSNHVTSLRDAGLVKAEPREGRRLLVVDGEAVRDLMLRLQGVLTGDDPAPEAAGPVATVLEKELAGAAPTTTW